MLDINSEKKLGIEVEVTISPSTVSIKKYSNSDLLLECRIRYLCFIGISTDVRLCGFIVHCIDNTFKCHSFLCDNSSGILCKTIEEACKLRYQKCLDAHPEAANDIKDEKCDFNTNNKLSNYLGNQFKNMFDSIKSRNFFSNYNLSKK